MNKDQILQVLKCQNIRGEWEGDLLLVDPGLADRALDLIVSEGFRYVPTVLEAELSC